MATSREYRLITRLAETEAGETWRAVAYSADGPTPAVLKILAPGFALPELLQAASARFAATASLKHPALIVPWELGTVQDRVVLSSAFVEGHDLSLVLARLESREVSLTMERAVHLMAEAGNAVSALHQASQVHGSLGPSNLFVSFEGAIRVSCSDFRTSLDALPRGRALAARGRKAYRAPELSRSANPAAAADVYALGAMAYELVCGKSLESIGPRGTSTRSDALQPPSRVDRRVPMPLDTIIMKALETAKSRRYHDAALFREALWAFLDDLGVVITPADLASFAASVLPNEVVQRGFDPEEACVGNPLLEGRFRIKALDPQSSAELTDGAPERTVRIAMGEGGPRVIENPASNAAAPPPVAAAAAPALPAGMLAEAPSMDLSDAEAAPLGAGDVFPHTVEMPVHSGGSPTPLADSQPPDASPGLLPLHTEVSTPAYRSEAEAALVGTALDEPLEPEDVSKQGAPRPPAAGRHVQVEAATSKLGTEVMKTVRQRRMWPWLLVAGIAPILIAIGFLLGRGPAPDPRDSVQAGGDDLGVAEGPHSRPQIPTPAETSPATAPETTKPVDSAPRGEASPGQRAASGNAVVGSQTTHSAKPPPKHQKRRPAKLYVYASHRARIYIDGRDTKHFTPLKGYRLAAGRHVITLIQPSTGHTKKKRITLRAGGRSTVRVRFR